MKLHSHPFERIKDGSKIIELRLQVNSRTRGLGAQLLEDAPAKLQDSAILELVKERRRKIRELYPATVNDYQGRQIHLHEDYNMATEVTKSHHEHTHRKVTLKYPAIQATKINQMFESIAEVANSLHTDRYCHVPRITLDQTIASYERLFNVTINEKENLKQKIMDGTKQQEKLLEIKSSS